MSSQLAATILIAITWTVISDDTINNIHFYSNPDTQLKACQINDIFNCNIYCDYHNCRYYKWLITDQTSNNSSITLNCEQPSSCYGLELHILDSIYSININEITINCGPNSCADLSLNLYPQSVYNENYIINPLQIRQYNIYCDAIKSCDSLKINQLSHSLPIEDDADTNMNELNIYCHGKYSCDNAIISYSDHTILNLYSYSRQSFGAESIEIHTNEYDTVNLYCYDDNDENTTNLMQYDTNSPLRNVGDLWYLAANIQPYEYAFPCQDIVILADDHEPCTIDYIISDYYNFIEMIQSEAEVFDLDVIKLYDIQCITDSRNKGHIFIIPYNISLNIDENECKQYLDKDTVNKNLEGLFSAALIDYMHNDTNEIITDIKPVRVDGDYNCDAVKLEEYQQINVKFDVKSINIARDIVEVVFDTNSMFYKQSMRIIDDYFGSVVTLADIHGHGTKTNYTMAEEFCVL